MKGGDLYQTKLNNPAGPALVEVVRTYDRRDIDYDCPESVAIISMVEVQVIAGTEIGRKMRCTRESFRRNYQKLDAS